MAVFQQPLFGFIHFGDLRPDDIPEARSMVRFQQMGKLMHNYIVLHPLGEPGQPVAYANGPGGAVAGPASPLLAIGVLDVVPGQTSLKISMVQNAGPFMQMGVILGIDSVLQPRA